MNGYKFDKGLDNQRVSNILSQNDTNRERITLQGKTGTPQP